MAIKVKQRTLADFQERAERIKSLEKSLKQLKTEQAREEKALLMAFDRRSPIERGVLSIGINITARRVVPWKEICAKELGPEFVQRILDATPETEYKHVIVIEAKRKGKV